MEWCLELHNEHMKAGLYLALHNTTLVPVKMFINLKANS